MNLVPPDGEFHRQGDKWEAVRDAQHDTGSTIRFSVMVLVMRAACAVPFLIIALTLHMAGVTPARTAPAPAPTVPTIVYVSEQHLPGTGHARRGRGFKDRSNLVPAATPGKHGKTRVTIAADAGSTSPARPN
jgi:hypothetical protein